MCIHGTSEKLTQQLGQSSKPVFSPTARIQTPSDDTPMEIYRQGVSKATRLVMGAPRSSGENRLGNLSQGGRTPHYIDLVGPYLACITVESALETNRDADRPLE